MITFVYSIVKRICIFTLADVYLQLNDVQSLLFWRLLLMFILISYHDLLFHTISQIGFHYACVVGLDNKSYLRAVVLSVVPEQATDMVPANCALSHLCAIHDPLSLIKKIKRSILNICANVSCRVR